MRSAWGPRRWCGAASPWGRRHKPEGPTPPPIGAIRHHDERLACRGNYGRRQPQQGAPASQSQPQHSAAVAPAVTHSSRSSRSSSSNSSSEEGGKGEGAREPLTSRAARTVRSQQGGRLLGRDGRARRDDQLASLVEAQCVGRGRTLRETSVRGRKVARSIRQRATILIKFAWEKSNHSPRG